EQVCCRLRILKIDLLCGNAGDLKRYAGGMLAPSRSSNHNAFQSNSRGDQLKLKFQRIQFRKAADKGLIAQHPDLDPRSIHEGQNIRLTFCICGGDRKSTRLNSSHVKISYAVFCLKKKKQN